MDRQLFDKKMMKNLKGLAMVLQALGSQQRGLVQSHSQNASSRDHFLTQQWH